MTMMVAVAGKGGVGKTTCSALLLRGLLQAGVRPLLAVDADPHANLHLLLALSLPPGLGSLREELLPPAAQGSAASVALSDRIAAEVQFRVAEGAAVDLVAMGRGEGPGCYCYVNSLLRDSLSRLEGGYRAVVVDNEAGMEHLSRRNVRRIDHLVLVGDPSPRGLSAVAAIRDLARELALPVGNAWLLLNCPYAGTERRHAVDAGLPLLAELPHDPSLPAWEASGRSFLDLPPGASAAADGVARAVAGMLGTRGGAR
jgi:CO dehydrogenase maturation factor